MLDGTAHQRQAYAVPGMAKVIMEDGQRRLKLQQSVLTGALSYQVSNLLSEDSKLICPKHFFTQTLLKPNAQHLRVQKQGFDLGKEAMTLMSPQ